MKISHFINSNELDEYGYDITDKRVINEHYVYFKNYLKENKIKICGDEHQESLIPVFDDGVILLYSYRAWGALMAEIWGEIDRVNYDYMDFYIKGW